ncbi:MAG: VTC domain-containing protein [Pseudomonadota bacterium]|nr:VTC domain-containing protein [Pseudomonadota bacterium]
MICKFSYYEYKYSVPNEKLAYVESLLESFAGGTDPFPIGYVDSVYYDTVDRRCFYECLNGESAKRKFRIRGYADGLYSQLHQKEKLLSGVGKFKSKLIEVSLRDNYPPDWESLAPVDADDENFHKIRSLASQYGLLLPSVRVRYQRRRYRTFDFRMTLDTNIEIYGYDNCGTTGCTILPYHVLEVKTYKRRPRLPFMGLVKLPQVSFSKFYLGISAIAS